MGNKLSSRRKNKYMASVTATSASSDDAQSSSHTSLSMTTSSNGRLYHDNATSSYWFPRDFEEMDRLIGQHFAIKTLFDGENIYGKGKSLLNLEKGAKILDIACGPGTWLMDVATEYPNCECVGVDMVDVFPTDIRPSNVKFQVGDVMQRLPFEDDTFDFIHVRLMLVALKKEEWEPMLREVLRVLKPGGCAQSVEAGMLENGNAFVLKAGFAFRDMMLAKGQHAYAASDINNLMSAAGFDVVEYERRDIVLSKRDQLTREFHWDLLNIFSTAQPVIQPALGITAEEYPQFIERLGIEMQKKPDANWSFTVCFGQKPHKV
ncbi:S-adenosyl-L-methionine-dependent methyltransferase [Syncephalastrum racemosum]|uniref:S-adenosyl-L-methionine-dependent methyltransferase n=1 Tax=Syncephalastrum racemosum TaxID=13706 RepID=A0A1X2HUS5_SYNRA|nr:S-adenosyl-L-methionine-dependent methyltransferase [Syncephalastrum racemosum]